MKRWDGTWVLWSEAEPRRELIDEEDLALMAQLSDALMWADVDGVGDVPEVP